MFVICGICSIKFFLLGLIFAAFVWWKRNVHLSIVLHILGNVLLRLTALIAVLAM